MKIITLVASAILVNGLMIAPAHALPQEHCKEVVIDRGSLAGKVANVFEEENRIFATIQTGGYEWIVGIPYDEMGKYKKLKGKNVNINYKVEQYWDDHDSECIREESIEKIVAR